MAEWYSSFMSSGTNQFFKFQTKMVRCHVDEKKGVLELGELEYHKKWYFPKYFRNSVADPIISKISANGPFCPRILLQEWSCPTSVLPYLWARCSWIRWLGPLAMSWAEKVNFLEKC